MSSQAGDALHARIREYVSQHVHPSQVEAVTEAAAYAVITVMSDPYFLNQFRVVQELQQENVWLRNQMAVLQTTLARYQPAAKKTAPRKRASPSKKVSASQKRAFGQGVRDLRG